MPKMAIVPSDRRNDTLVFVVEGEYQFLIVRIQIKNSK